MVGVCVQQYWSRDSEPYSYVSAGQFAAAFEASEQGRAMQKAAETEYQRPEPYYDDLEPLIRKRCAFQSKPQLIQTCGETWTRFVL